MMNKSQVAENCKYHHKIPSILIRFAKLKFNSKTTIFQFEIRVLKDVSM